MIDPRRITFAPMREQDLPLMATWLQRPHMAEWWDNPATELAQLSDMIAGRDTTRPFIFHLDGEPVGYIQVWFIAPHQTPEWTADHPWLAELPADAVGVDLSIGDAGRLSQGIGSAALLAFVRRLQAEGHHVIIIDPDPENTRAVRAYAKAGFRAIPELLSKTGDCLLMRFEPNESELTP